jgi:hypothetical protein
MLKSDAEDENWRIKIELDIRKLKIDFFVFLPGDGNPSIEMIVHDNVDERNKDFQRMI